MNVLANISEQIAFNMPDESCRTCGGMLLEYALNTPVIIKENTAVMQVIAEKCPFIKRRNEIDIID